MHSKAAITFRNRVTYLFIQNFIIIPISNQEIDGIFLTNCEPCVSEP